jgi:tetratricopeptide (TPR) repeat protein
MFHLDRKQEAQAIDALHKAIANSPHWPLPYASLAGLLERGGRLDDAVAVYRDALTAMPDDPAVLAELAHHYERQKDYPNAIAQYDRILAKSSDNLPAINNLANLLSLDTANAANLQRAKSLARRLVGQKDPAFLDTIGWVDYQAGDYGKARETLQQAVAANDREPVFLFHLGMAALKTGDRDQARELIGKAVASERQFAELDQAREVLRGL